MSRIAVVTSSPPMSDGGHMVIARSLVQALRDAGHQADVIVTPQNRFGRQASAYLATWLTDVEVTHTGPIAQVISLRYPSFAVRHRRHVCWLNHTMREYYDLWDRFRAGLGLRGRVKERVRRTLIRQAGWPVELTTDGFTAPFGPPDGSPRLWTLYRFVFRTAIGQGGEGDATRWRFAR